jgi:hypothetical protein
MWYSLTVLFIAYTGEEKPEKCSRLFDRRERSISLEAMEPNLFRFYDIMKKIVSLTGQWPYQRRRVRLFRLTIINVFLLSGISPQVTTWIYIIYLFYIRLSLEKLFNGNAICIYDLLTIIFLDRILYTLWGIQAMHYNNHAISFLDNDNSSEAIHVPV